MLTLKYLDKISYIKPGGSSRSGKVPDKLCDVFFLRKESDDIFSFLYKDSDDGDKLVGYAAFKSIVFVNGEAST